MSSSLKERLPEVLPVFRESRLAAIVEAIETQIDELRGDTESVADSLAVETAAGESLDQIGADFGLIGRRRGRTDVAYRRFIQSLVPAFEGRGTENDVRIAVAAAVAADAGQIDLREIFSAREYQVELFDWTAHQTGTVHELADLSDPVAVDRVDPLYYFADPAVVTVTTSLPVSEPAVIGVDAASARSTRTAVGLSALGAAGLSGSGLRLSAVIDPVPDGVDINRKIDLTRTGEVATVDVSGAETVGYQIRTDTPVTFEVQTFADGVGPFTAEIFTRQRIDDQTRVADADRVRVVQTASTGRGTGRILLGKSN
jgi:hypothetical protein